MMKRKKIALAVMSATLLVCSLALSAAAGKLHLNKNAYSSNVQAYWDESEEFIMSKKSLRHNRFLEAIKPLENNIQPVNIALEAQSKNKASSIPSSRGGTINTAKPKSSSTKPAAKPAATAPINKYSSAEIDLLSRLVSAEAEAESFEGKLAVATVIMNRVKSSAYPNTIKGVIYDSNWGIQFTPVADGRINLPATAEARKAAITVLNGYRSFGPSILYFLNPQTSQSRWISENKTFYKRIGNHNFYY